MDIKTKTIEATIEDVEGSSGPGEFTVALATPDLDRDGDELTADGWEMPLPEHITFVNDHTHKVNSVVGSAKPTLEGENIICRGTYAETDNAQDTRKLVRGKHITHVSVAYREKRAPGGRTVRELVNGSFVVVPANTHAMVLASKGLTVEGELTEETKEFIKSIVEEALSIKADDDGKKPYGDVTYADPGYQEDGKKRYPLDTEKHVRAAWSYINQGDNSKAYSSDQLSSIKGKIRSAAKKFGIEITDKDYELPAPEEPTGTAAADSADQERKVKVLATARAKAMSFATRHVND